jgi:hypothetical protein
VRLWHHLYGLDPFLSLDTRDCGGDRAVVRFDSSQCCRVTSIDRSRRWLSKNFILARKNWVGDRETLAQTLLEKSSAPFGLSSAQNRLKVLRLIGRTSFNAVTRRCFDRPGDRNTMFEQQSKLLFLGHCSPALARMRLTSCSSSRACFSFRERKELRAGYCFALFNWS